MEAKNLFEIFESAINDYHVIDHVDAEITNPFSAGTIENVLYHKNWIDTVQWHLEDIVREPSINGVYGMEIKRRIDKSNQDRTDMVEKIDDYFLSFLSKNMNADAPLNTESIGWVVDRISILCLKIYHMNEQVHRSDVDESHLAKCKAKLEVLLEQKSDMSLAYTQLVEDINKGLRRFKVYRQMKMYNDETLNPVLYKKS